MDELRSKRHRVYGQHMNKVSSVPFDSKHWLTENEVGVSEMDAVIDELLSVWKPHLVAAGCHEAPRGAPPGQSHVLVHLTSNIAQAYQAWWPSVLVGTPGGTRLDQSPFDGHPPARQAGIDSERRHEREAFALWDQRDGLENSRGFCAIVLALVASEGFLPVRRITIGTSSANSVNQTSDVTRWILWWRHRKPCQHHNKFKWQQNMGYNTPR